MRAQQFQRLRRGRSPPPTRRLLRQNFDRAVHADRENLFDIGDIGIDRPVFHIGAKAADRGFDHLAVIGVRADLARQTEQGDGAFQRQTFRPPAFRQAGARWFRHRFACLALLHIGAEPPGAQGDFHAIRILPQHAAINRARVVTARNRPCVAALRIVAAPNERRAGSCGFQMQPPGPTGLADARVRAIRAHRVKVRRHEFINFFQYFTDPKVGGPGNRRREIPPESA